ncbi:MAG: hypothetical protein M0C28_31340 [Candidatus Moduliflexus flocculans]|nr:hypothetical protein [Candidatus Moduliflexus flocculans]
MVVVGYGLAGASAVLQATDDNPEAKIVIFERCQGARAARPSLPVVPPSGRARVARGLPQVLRTLFLFQPRSSDYFEWFTYQFTVQLPWIKGVIEPVGYEIGYQGGGPVVWGKKITEFPGPRQQFYWLHHVNP